jgi:hypothetical protein
MEDFEERAFFNALHQYIQRVVSENPNGPPNLNVTESPARADMRSALDKLIRAKVDDLFKNAMR